MDPPNSVSNSHYYCYSQAQLMAWLAPGDDESSLEPMPAQIQRRIAVLGVTPSLRWNLWKRLLRVSLYLSFEQTHLSFGSHACTPSRMHTHTQTARQTQTDTHTHKQICTYVYIYIYIWNLWKRLLRVSVYCISIFGLTLIQRRIAVLGVTPSLRWNLWKRLLRVSVYCISIY